MCIRIIPVIGYILTLFIQILQLVFIFLLLFSSIFFLLLSYSKAINMNKPYKDHLMRLEWKVYSIKKQNKKSNF
jgi:hypothetical protein